MLPRYPLEVNVLEADGNPVVGATVQATPTVPSPTTPNTANWDGNRQVYFFATLRTGWYDLVVSHAGHETERRRVQVHPRPTEEDFVLTPAGGTYLIRGQHRVPVTAPPGLIGIIPAPPESLPPNADVGPGNESMEQLLERLNLRPRPPEPDVFGVAGAAGVRHVPANPGAMVVTRPPGPGLLAADTDAGALQALRESRLVATAGPVVFRSGPGFSVLTNRLRVRFRPEVARDQIDRLLNAHQLTPNQVLQLQVPVHVVEAPPGAGLAHMNALAGALLNSGLVEYAEPELAEAPALDAITPTCYLWSGAWDRGLVGAENAWQRLHDAQGAARQFGSPGVIVAVVDQGIWSLAGVVRNADFAGKVSDGSEKVYRLYDFSSMGDTNDYPLGDHGVACAGVAVGRADAPAAPVPGFGGTAGAAPNVRLLGLIYPSAESRIIQMFLWAAGLDVGKTPPNFPDRITPGADIFTCSIGFGQGSPISPAVKDMLDRLTNRGRKGKGCLALFSAGNGDWDITTNRPYGNYERSFSCAASSVNAAGAEIRAPYSGYGRVAWCAPSHDDYVGSNPLHDPPDHRAVWTAGFTDRGNLPSFPRVTTTLTASATAGDTTITVGEADRLLTDTYLLIGTPAAGEPVRVTGPAVLVSGPPNPVEWSVPVSPLRRDRPAGTPVAAGPARLATLTAAAAAGATTLHVTDVSQLVAGQRVLLGAPSSPLLGREEVRVMVAPIAGWGVVTVSAVAGPHAVGAEVVADGNHHKNNFGGTSSATPLSAGIAALVLSAQPQLTWVEAREILRTTAQKINPGEIHPVGRWLDEDGNVCHVSGKPPVFSRWYGYGRLDADAAVKAALAYAFPRDLLVRDTLTDDGTAPTDPAVRNSPDLWVRTTDPATDPAALPANYATAGPHQDPSRTGSAWVYVRIRNRGTDRSLDAWARVYVASGRNAPFDFPGDWEASNGLVNPTPTVWEPATYLIGELALPSIDGGKDIVVNLPWPAALMPPDKTPAGDPWDPHLLVEISPHDGPLTGTGVHENNNLAQKAVKIT